MKRVDLDQAGPSWHKWRKGGLGGSDACAVMGDVGWTSPDELMENKLGMREFAESARMARGKELEPEARRLYCERHGVQMEPVCVEHDQHPCLRASLDGLSPDGSLVLEIKCPSYAGHKKALWGIYPDYYRAQLQHQLMVTGAARLHYASYRPDPAEFQADEYLAVLEVLPDPEYQARLMEAELAFWERKKALEARLGKGRGKKRPRR